MMKKIPVILLLIFLPSVHYADEVEGKIIFITGKEYKTRMKGVKEWASNTSDTTLKSGMRIKTDENTSLRVILKDRFIVFVPGDSDINFTKLSESEELITILKGDILYKALNNKVKGIINTPTAEIIREKAAELIIRVNSQDGTTELYTLDEEISVKNIIQSDNNYKIVKKGTYSKVLPQVLPTEPSLYRYSDIEEIIKKIKTPISSGRVKISEKNIFERFIEDFQFDSFFKKTPKTQSQCKDIYTSPYVPADFDKNLLLKESTLILNYK
jgi:hypothetical protein